MDVTMNTTNNCELFGGPTFTKKKLSDTSFYAKIQKDLTSKNQKLVKDTIQNLIVNQELPDSASNLIINTPRTSCIYFLPKIHKPNNPGRPIASACSCPTEPISSYLHRIMTPIVKSLPSYIKDTRTKYFPRFQFLRPRRTYFHHGHYISVHSHSQ